MTKSSHWRRFGARDPHEPNRVATPLELLFDLVIVIAVASAAKGLHHAVAQGHAGLGIVTFASAFFATWWAWMNFTWFASAYDNDGPVFRVLTCIIMAGALVVAAGVPQMFVGLNLSLAIIGYIVMRAGMVLLWLGAARSDQHRRATALTYALGIAAVQVYWTIALLVFRPASFDAVVVLFGIGAALEMAVPVLAERHAPTPWHLHHLAERHSSFVIIVLGEVLLSSAAAFTYADAPSGHLPHLVMLGLSALAITFAMWWLYFSQEGPLDRDRLGSAFRWGYVHAVIYAAGAATGAGFGVAIDSAAGQGHHVPPLIGNLAVAIPLATYMVALWFVRDRLALTGRGRHGLLPIAAVICASASLGAVALPAMALVSIAAVALRTRVATRA